MPTCGSGSSSSTHSRRSASYFWRRFGPAEGDEMDIDSGLLAAFLEIGKFEHGARSLETIMGLTRADGSPGIRRSALPPEDQLSLHVDYDEFMGLVDLDMPFKMNSEELAPAVHEDWLALCRTNGWPLSYDMEFEQLPDGVKADNIAAAARIPRVLALVGLAVVVEDHPSTLSRAKVLHAIESNVDLLAECEHDGWMEQKYRDGWSHGLVRDDDAKKHPCLVQYANLSEEDKEKDRNAVRHYPEIVELAGFKIVAAGGDDLAPRQLDDLGVVPHRVAVLLLVFLAQVGVLHQAGVLLGVVVPHQAVRPAVAVLLLHPAVVLALGEEVHVALDGVKHLGPRQRRRVVLDHHGQAHQRQDAGDARRGGDVVGLHAVGQLLELHVVGEWPTVRAAQREPVLVHRGGELLAVHLERHVEVDQLHELVVVDVHGELVLGRQGGPPDARRPVGPGESHDRLERPRAVLVLADLEEGGQQPAVDVHLGALGGAEEPAGGPHEQGAADGEAEVAGIVVVDPFLPVSVVLLAPVRAGDVQIAVQPADEVGTLDELELLELGEAGLRRRGSGRVAAGRP